MKPELLSSEAIGAALKDGYWRVSVLEESTSTQTQLRESSPKDGDVITAEYQSAGRGRLDRKFEAVKSSALLFSCYMKPNISKEFFGKIPLLAGVAVAKSINEITNSKNFKCKWPNDILFDEKKIAGLLCEAYGDGVIIGIGINVSTAEEDLPVNHASSIFLETQKIIDRNKLLVLILNNLKETIHQGCDLLEYEQYCSTLEKAVSITLPSGEVISDVAQAISEAGALVFKSGREVTVGDLIHITTSN